MVWGKHEEKLKRIQKKGIFNVKALENKPELDTEYSFVWNMWNSLHRTRQSGSSATPILFSEAVSWIKLFCPDYSMEDTEFTLDLYWALEEEWLVWARKEENKK